MITQTFQPQHSNAPARNVITMTADDMTALGAAPLQLTVVNLTMPDGRVGIVAFTIFLSAEGKLWGKVSDYSHDQEFSLQICVRPERRP